MKKILIFAGTTEGRKLSECLGKAEIFHTMCVATEYGEIVLHENPYVKIHQGRMDQEEMRTFILDGKYAAFGSVIEGMTVVDTIVKSRVITRSPYGGGKDRPVEPPVMKKVTVETFGVEYPEPEKM